MVYLGIDIGGTKTLLAVFDENGAILTKLKFLTNQDYSNFLTDLRNNISKLNQDKFERCGVAVPGLIDRKTGNALAFGNLPWKNVPIKDDIEAIAGCNTKVEHDGCIGGLFESRQLNPPLNKVLYLTVSTGIGSGMIIDNKIDVNYASSEPGQMEIYHDGKLEKWESFASGKAILKKFGKQAKDIDDTNSWSEISHNLALGCLELMAIIQPDVIIFGGSVGNYFEKFEKPLKEKLEDHYNPLIKLPVLKKATKAEECVIYGCYELIKND
jgi:glucokinase